MIYYVIFIPILSYIIDIVLVLLNIRHQSIMESKNNIFDTTEYYEALKYNREKSLEKLVYLLTRNSYIVLCLLLFGNIFYEFMSSISDSSYIRLVGTIFLVYTGFQILSSLFEGYTTFHTEEKYHFNKMTPKAFIKEQIIDYVMTSIIVIICSLMFLFLYQTFDMLFIYISFALIILLLIMYHSLFVVIVLPLMFSSKPLEDGSLKRKIEKFVQVSDFNLDSIEVIDASTKTTKINAYFSGFGRKKKILLFDTLLDKFTDEQIVSIVAHEVGHSKYNHMLKDLIQSVMTSFVYFSVFYLLLNINYTSDLPVVLIGFLHFIVILEGLHKLSKLISNTLSRYHEKQADSFVKDKGYGTELKETLMTAVKTNKGSMYPHPLFVLFKYDHPPSIDRIDYLN